MRRLATFGMEPGLAGGLLCGLGFALLVPASLITAALGVELVAAAFWVWARAAPDAGVQVARWAWLRRPATALWLAVVIHAVDPGLSHGRPASGIFELLRWLEAIAVLWAGLELMAALPVARPYSDLAGPLVTMRLWLPVMLPAAGFAVLWRQSVHWTGVDAVRHVAVPLLLLTAVLGALRAFARRSWIASLRWLAVTDSAMAGLLVSLGAVPAEPTLLLWLAACGTHASLLAGELRGAVTRRGVVITRSWQVAGWVGIACLSFPLLLSLSARRGSLHTLYFAGAALTTALSTWITVGRMNVAAERRMVMRLDPVLTLSQTLALLMVVVGPLALGLAWWAGVGVLSLGALAAIAPAALGGAAVIARRRGGDRPPWRQLGRVGAAAPGLASGAYGLVVRLERLLVGLVVRLFQATTSPIHDLHTGDAQEYLLFLVGLGVLALVLPLLQ